MKYPHPIEDDKAVICQHHHFRKGGILKKWPKDFCRDDKSGHGKNEIHSPEEITEAVSSKARR